MKSANFVLTVVYFVTAGFGVFTPAHAQADDSFDYSAMQSKNWTGQDSLREKGACSVQITALKTDLAQRRYREFSIRTTGLSVPLLVLRGQEASAKSPDRTVSAEHVLYSFAFEGGTYSLEITTTRGANPKMIEYSLYKTTAATVKVAYCQNLR
jgi:hypothetical protein